MQIFSTEGPLYKFISRLWDVIVLNFIWLVFSIPIVTIGPSTVAAYSVALKMVDDEEGYIVRSFIKAFKENLKQGFLLGLITMASAYMIYLNFELYSVIESNPMPLLVVGIFASVVFGLSLLYAYPLIARYENSIYRTLRNSFEISLRYFVRTIILLLILAIEILIINYNLTTMLVGIILGPAFMIFTIASFSKRVFQKIHQDQGEE